VAALYCRIRKTPVEAAPEEYVRQGLLSQMIDTLGYPPGMIAVEKELKQLPHLLSQQSKLPTRRIDILVFAKNIHPSHELYPLLLVECKAVKLNDQVVNQTSGYNYYIQAYFVALANSDEIKTGWYDRKRGEYVFIPYLPSYQDLVKYPSLP
jgi:hypothetical protein